MVCAAGVVFAAAVLGADAQSPSAAVPAPAAAAPAPPVVAPPPPDPAAGVTNALATGNATAAREAFAVLFAAPADQRPSRAAMDVLEARILLVEKQWASAADLLTAVLDAPGTLPAEQRAAWELLAQCHTACGNDAAAAAALAKAQALHREQNAVNLASSSQYYRNRFAIDGERSYAAARLADTARTAAAAERPALQADTLLARCLAFPDEPRLRENALAAAEALLACAEAHSAGQSEHADTAAAAATCLLRTLDSGMDRAFADTALLSENQPQIDAVARPLPPAAMARALVSLNRAEQLAQSGRGIGEETLADFAAAYSQALALTYRPESTAAATALAALSETVRPPWCWLALLELARVHLRDADVLAATAVLDRIAPARRLLGIAAPAPLDRLYAAERDFLRGFAAETALDHRQAAKHFGQAADLGGPLLAPRARFEQARALELAGEWAQAAAVYAGLCPEALPRDRGPAAAVPAHEQPSVGISPSYSAGQPASAAAMGALYPARPSAAVDMLRGVRGASQVPRAGSGAARPASVSVPAPPCLARAAAVALARVDSFAAAGGLPGAGPVQALPDDRTTRGDWFLGYGTERYILCAQNYRLDRAGGPLDEFAVRFSTTDPKEPGRLWVSAKRTDDPAALWDPAHGLRLPSNRDDRGEQYPVGNGPDLLLDGAIPAGMHILSLYFVNDHHYYEANRRYTVQVCEGDAVLALADVRDFGGGVYKRFRVAGPRGLRIRIRRDASMNVLLQGVFLDRLYEVRPLPQAVVDAGLGPTTPPGDRGPAAAVPTHDQPSVGVSPSGSAGPPASAAAMGALYPARPSAAADMLRGVRGASQVPRAGSGAAIPAAIPEPLWRHAEALRADGRWRAAEAVSAEFAKAIPDWAVEPLLRELAAAAPPGAEEAEGRYRLYPSGRYPLDLLWDRRFHGDTPLTVAELAAVVRSREPFVTPLARRIALAALEAHAVAAGRTVDPDLLMAAARRFQAAGWDPDAEGLLRRCLAPTCRPDLRQEAAIGLLRVAGNRQAPAPAVQALWQECDAVLATAPGALRDIGVVHAAAALADSGDRAAALAMLAQHSNPTLREAMARPWQTPQPAAAGRGANGTVKSAVAP